MRDELREVWHEWGEMGRLFAHKTRHLDGEKLCQIKDVIASSASCFEQTRTSGGRSRDAS